MTLTEDQARLLWRHSGGWLLAAIIVDTDYGISTLKSRAGGCAWPDGSYPELPYHRTWTTNNGIIGYSGDKDDEPAVSVSFNAIRKWADQVPEPIKTELRLQFAAMGDERDRTMGWCRCPYASEAPNPDGEPCKRHHPTEVEDQRHREWMAVLDERQAEFVQAALGLVDETTEPVESDGQLSLFGALA